MSHHVSRVAIESDSMQVIRFLNAPLDISHEFANLAQYIFHLKKFHGSLRFSHFHRDANSLRDYLARVATRFPLELHLFTYPFGDCHRIIAHNNLEVVPNNPFIALE